MSKDESIIWRFQVAQGYDIGFCVLYSGTTDGTNIAEALQGVCNQKAPIVTPTKEAGDGEGNDEIREIEVVREYTRCKTTVGGQTYTQGLFTAPGAGYVRLFWDNRYSVLTGKNLHYVSASVSPEAVEAALQAADMVTNMQSQPRSQIYENIVRSPELVTVRVSGPVAIATATEAEEHEDNDEEDVVLAPRSAQQVDESKQEVSTTTHPGGGSSWVSSGMHMAVDALSYLGTTPSSVHNYTTQLLGVIASRYSPAKVKQASENANSQESQADG